MAKQLDRAGHGLPQPPPGRRPYTFVRVDARPRKVREDGRKTGVHALVAVSVNADGHREIPGPDMASSEDGADWPVFLRSLVARGLSGVRR
ncbi:transposase [Streptomyces minutiscleroticus]|uniref:transposase n=1 Tax=Streptomyces minutiscleroticus TaxID=68238 RepID=UPI003D9DEA8B